MEHPIPFSKKVSLFLLSASAILVGAILFNFVELELPTPEELADWLHGPVAIIGLMIVHSFIPFPAELLAICADAVYGTIAGSVLIWSGAMLGGLAAFYLSRMLGRDAVRTWISASQAKALDRWAEDQGAITLLVSRFIPLISFNLIDYAAGLTRVSVWTFIWTSALGIIPLTVLSTYLGSQMKTMNWTTVLILSTTGIAILILCHWIAKRKSRI